MTELHHVLVAALSTEPKAGKTHALQEALKSLPPYECHVDHVFAPGVYARCINMPAGFACTSKLHKTEHLAIVCSGRVTVSTDDENYTVTGPQIFITKPGTKRALYVHEDCVWITIHVTDSTDLEEIERQVIGEELE